MFVAAEKKNQGTKPWLLLSSSRSNSGKLKRLNTDVDSNHDYGTSANSFVCKKIGHAFIRPEGVVLNQEPHF